MRLDLINALVLLTGIMNLSLGLLIYFQGPKTKSNFFFAGIGWSIFLWALSMFFYRAATTVETSIIWAKILYISASFIPLSFLYFVYVFPTDKFSVQKTIRIVIILLNVSLIIFVLIPKTVISNVTILGVGEKIIDFGILYSLYSVYIGGYFAIAFLVLWEKHKQADEKLKKQIQFIFFGALISVVLGTTTNLILPTFGIFRLNWLGQITTIFLFIAVAYAIVQHQLLKVKVIAAELLTGFMVFVLIGETFLSKSPVELILRLVFLLLVCIFGYFLIRSVFNEVRQKEQLEILSKELGLANKELSRLDQAKSEFLSIASHQLRTPLTAIKGYSSMLLDGTFGPIGGKIKEGVEKVYASTERMVALVNDLLDTSRLDSGRMVFTFVETDLGEVVKSVCDELMPKGKEKGLAIACMVAPATPKVFVDQMKIRQVLVNFLDNALKYSDTGTVEVKLETRPHPNPLLRGEGEEGDELVFSVRDNGWGMTPEEMGFLFKKFSRGSGDTSKIKGTGLGLYVARRLAEAHGGRVWAESLGKGQGSTFLLALKVGWRPPTGDGVYQPKEE